MLAVVAVAVDNTVELLVTDNVSIESLSGAGDEALAVGIGIEVFANVSVRTSVVVMNTLNLAEI